MSKSLDMQDKKTQSMLFDMIQEDANRRRLNAGFNGEHHDGGASALESNLEIYKAGLAGEIPKNWEGYENKIINTLDPDYETYLKLKDKFENKK